MKEIGCEGAEWFHVAQDIVQLTTSYEHNNELSGSIKGRTFLY
jgi:hypothetical protein